MADRTSSSLGLYCWNSLFYWLSLMTILFLLSSFIVLRTSNRSYFLSRHSSSVNIMSDNLKPGLGYSFPCERAELKCGLKKQILKVFMYDLPVEFHFGLLDWIPDRSSVWPDIRTQVPIYPGGLNLQHSIEYWLTLDLLFSEYSGPSSSHIAIRVHNSSEADVIFVPFFASLSFNRYSRLRKQERRSYDKVIQDKLVKYLEEQEEWKRSGGVDHIIIAHHPNSLLYARNQLWPAMFILSDFGRYPPNIANVQKDIIAPYRHVIKSFPNDTSTYDTRPILLFFQGAIYRKDVSFHFKFLFYCLIMEYIVIPFSVSYLSLYWFNQFYLKLCIIKKTVKLNINKYVITALDK